MGGKYLNQNLEIEFKNELTEEEYTLLVKKEFEGLSHSKHMTFQTNYYFDTRDHQLKQMKSALRIRKTPSLNELTLKVPSQGFLLETNISLSDNECSALLNANHIKLSDITSDIMIKDLKPDSEFYLFNQFETIRYEKDMDGHLLVLDQTTFQNGVVDYELEVESQSPEAGLDFFNSFLEKHAIKKKKALQKIARAERFKDKN